MGRIVTRTLEEESSELIAKTAEEVSKKSEEKFRKILEESGVGSGLGGGAGTGGTGGSKISQIIKSANKGTSPPQGSELDDEIKKLEKTKTEEIHQLEETKKKEREEFDKEKERLQKELEENEVFCPSCSIANKHDKHEHEGHKHILKHTDKGTLKCSGENCGTEYALIPTNSDYECKTCGAPHKKPVVENPDDKCPFCTGKEFLEKDWTKLINKKKK